MIRIAILGDIGAGKSFVSKQFNCPLFNADKEVAEIYKNDRSCYQKIKKALPKYCLLYTSPSPRDRTRSRMPSSA